MSKTEFLWAATSYLSMLMFILITGVCFSCFVQPYLRLRRTAVQVGAVYIAVMLFLYHIPLKFHNFTAYFLGMAAAFLVMVWKERKNVEQKLFLAVTFFSLRWLSFVMASQIDELLYRGLMSDVRVSGNEAAQYAIYVITTLVNVGASLLFLMTAVYVLNRVYRYKKAALTRTELLMLVIPSISGMIGYGVLKFYQDIYAQVTGQSLSEVHGIYGVLSFLHYLFSVVAIVVMTMMFQNLKARQEEAVGQKLLQSQLADMKKHISEVERLHRDIRLLRHDMGNHIQTIEHLIECNEADEAARYTAEWKKMWQQADLVIKTGNPVTDVILSEKRKEAQERQVSFVCDFHYPQDCGINAFDISIIINNALDNSLEAVCGDEPYISISSYRKNNVFMIAVENSFTGRLVTDGEDGLPASTKEGRGHGLGLANIQRVAKKYLGDIALEQENGKVILTVMLQTDGDCFTTE